MEIRNPEPIEDVYLGAQNEAEPSDGLSARQREVLELVAACLEDAEIADSGPYRSRHRDVSAEVLSGEALRAHARGSSDVAADRT